VPRQKIPRVAALMGVKPDLVISATFVIGAVLAAIAGIMWAAMKYGTVQHPWASCLA
jgi:branched-chain amino acid transport system permease protein